MPADLTSLLSKFLEQLLAGTVDVGNSGDALLVRDAANTIAQRNSTNAQSLFIYGTFTNASNYERLEILAGAGNTVLGSRAAGSGTIQPIEIRGTIVDAGGFIINSSNVFGYNTGAGGTVTQATSKSTGVTLDKQTGEITMNAAALAADTTVSFTLTNSKVAAGDYVLVQHVSAGTQAAYNVTALAAAGSATVNVRNVTPGSLSEAIVLKFMVFKSATS